MEGRRALVTGGASGIGKATATLLAERGARVVTVDLKGGDIDADLREPAAVEAAVAEAAERLRGPVDLLVAAAGVYRIQPALDLDAAAWDDVHAINLRGVFLTCRAVAARLIEAGHPGAIVNLASTAALEGDAAEPSAHYNASKAGVVALTRQLAIELASHRIRVNCVCPGMIDTPMLRVLDTEAGAAWVKRAVPLARLGRPEEVAAVLVFLASDEASYVTGVALPIDGGLTA